VSTLAAVIAYQLVWLIAVAGAGRGSPWPGTVAAGVYVTVQVARTRRPWHDLRVLALGLVLGVLLDGTLAGMGWLRYAAAVPALPPGGAPVWILALWAAFALTLVRELGWLRGRPLLAVLLGACGGPLAYLAAARGWNAVTLMPPQWIATSALAVGWALATVVLLRLSDAQPDRKVLPS
jgi:hypothetical protein